MELSTSKKDFLIIADSDDVAVSLHDFEANTTHCIEGTYVTLQDDIPFGHKVALHDITQDTIIRKYGHPIGHATAPIPKGTHVHTHNLKTNLNGVLDYSYKPLLPSTESDSLQNLQATFQGYVRTNGKVGIRNEVWILPTVGCVNTTASILAKGANQKFAGKTDGIYSYSHNMGCSQLGDDHIRTQQILKGLLENPNAGAVLVLSLGCENNNLDSFLPMLGNYDAKRVRFLVTQEVDDEFTVGMELISELVTYASTFTRKTVSADKLVLGFKCGGSDAFSGITANALCGRINDIVCMQNGATILTEVPEMFGAETLLMERAISEEVFSDTVDLINDFKSYFTKYKQTIYENPSPGNKKGGISSLEEKSLGCTQKGGMAPVTGVLSYGESVTGSGLHLLTGPGNDQVSCTNLTASGAQMILFTTGRGNPFGAPIPTVKISSNSLLATKKRHWIDYNAGQLLEGHTFQEISEDFFQYLLEVASGNITTKNEDYGYREISIFRDGVIL